MRAGHLLGRAAARAGVEPPRRGPHPCPASEPRTPPPWEERGAPARHAPRRSPAHRRTPDRGPRHARRPAPVRGPRPVAGTKQGGVGSLPPPASRPARPAAPRRRARPACPPVRTGPRSPRVSRSRAAGGRRASGSAAFACAPRHRACLERHGSPALLPRSLPPFPPGQHDGSASNRARKSPRAFNLGGVGRAGGHTRHKAPRSPLCSHTKDRTRRSRGRWATPTWASCPDRATWPTSPRLNCWRARSPRSSANRPRAWGLHGHGLAWVELHLLGLARPGLRVRLLRGVPALARGLDLRLHRRLAVVTLPIRVAVPDAIHMVTPTGVHPFLRARGGIEHRGCHLHRCLCLLLLHGSRLQRHRQENPTKETHRPPPTWMLRNGWEWNPDVTSPGAFGASPSALGLTFARPGTSRPRPRAAPNSLAFPPVPPASSAPVFGFRLLASASLDAPVAAACSSHLGNKSHELEAAAGEGLRGPLRPGEDQEHEGRCGPVPVRQVAVGGGPRATWTGGLCL
ncbi:hypothetical protein MXAN_0067 [Myxococcus xanthus DK 1622]|uniref:Uncharacterized protein n=1 Tax=Myxococcus xanthus (strain DK1622) TaxID=246197 RepID=Q1DG75_MYXXD|nr:hypothetical protein MXAN_0067 [Myxococcus xanthus DK 1622]